MVGEIYINKKLKRTLFQKLILELSLRELRVESDAQEYEYVKGQNEREREREKYMRKREEFDFPFEMEKVFLIRGEEKRGKEESRW